MTTGIGSALIPILTSVITLFTKDHTAANQGYCPGVGAGVDAHPEGVWQHLRATIKTALWSWPVS